MGLIKAGTPRCTPQAFSMVDIEKQAQDILMRAQQEAQRILAAVAHESDMLRQNEQSNGYAVGMAEGYKEGFDEGRKAGYAEALHQHGPALKTAAEALLNAVRQIDRARVILEADVLNDVIDLAVGIARRVTKRLGQLDPQVLLENVGEALRLVIGASDLRIAINPAQKSVLEQALPRLQVQWPNLRHVELVEDPALALGGCRIYTRHGMIDAELSSQLDRIAVDLVPAKDGDARPQ